jgi:hypothetical protein
VKDIVIIPTFDRPEYLWACLENIYEIHQDETKEFWISEDVHADKPKSFTIEIEMLATVREWQKKFGSRFRYIGRSPHTTYGNSYNVLSALCEAAATDARYVYLIEDDVLITQDFFAWNEEVHNKFQPWASCAGRLNRSLNFAMNGPEAIDESIKDVNACVQSITAYNSWATCFSRLALSEITDKAELCFDKFRPGFEQDIMIQNMIRGRSHHTIWPYVPRAYHMGWYSYHRDGMRFYGSLEEKVKALQAAVTDQGKIRAMASIQQIDAFPLNQHKQAIDLYLR